MGSPAGRKLAAAMLHPTAESAQAAPHACSNRLSKGLGVGLGGGLATAGDGARHSRRPAAHLSLPASTRQGAGCDGGAGSSCSTRRHSPHKAQRLRQLAVGRLVAAAGPHWRDTANACAWDSAKAGTTPWLADCTAVSARAEAAASRLATAACRRASAAPLSRAEGGAALARRRQSRREPPHCHRQPGHCRQKSRQTEGPSPAQPTTVVHKHAQCHTLPDAPLPRGCPRSCCPPGASSRRATAAHRRRGAGHNARQLCRGALLGGNGEGLPARRRCVACEHGNGCCTHSGVGCQQRCEGGAGGGGTPCTCSAAAPAARAGLAAAPVPARTQMTGSHPAHWLPQRTV
jgi:hypothetical protein